MTVQELQELYDSTPTWTSGDARSNQTFKLIATGAVLFERVFGIHLDISETIRLIEGTQEIGSDDLFDLVCMQLATADLNDDEKPRERWIDSPVYFRGYIANTRRPQSPGYCYTIANLEDLLRKLRKSGMSLPQFAEILQKRWPGVEYKSVKIPELGMRVVKCVFIPEDAPLHPQTVHGNPGEQLIEDSREFKLYTIMSNMTQELRGAEIPANLLVERVAIEGWDLERLKRVMDTLVLKRVVFVIRIDGEIYYSLDRHMTKS